TGSLILQSDYNSYGQLDKSKDYDAYQEQGYTGKVGYFLQKQINQKIENLHKLVDFVPDTYHVFTNGKKTSFFMNDINTPVEINPQGNKIVATASKIRIDTKRGFFHPFHVGNPAYWQPNYNLLTKDF